jgi:hypothetical protein
MTEQVWEPKRVICMFRDWDDAVKQVWRPKRTNYEFRDWDDTDKQVWRPKQSIYKVRDRDDDIAEQVRGPLMNFTLYIIWEPLNEWEQNNVISLGIDHVGPSSNETHCDLV